MSKLELAGYSQFYGMDSDELVQFLKSNGFGCGVYIPDERQIMFTDRPWELGVQNVLAINDQHRDFVVKRIRDGGPRCFSARDILDLAKELKIKLSEDDFNRLSSERR